MLLKMIFENSIINLNWSISFESFSKLILLISILFHLKHFSIKFYLVLLLFQARTFLLRVEQCIEWNRIEINKISFENDQRRIGYSYEHNLRWNVLRWNVPRWNVPAMNSPCDEMGGSVVDHILNMINRCIF